MELDREFQRNKSNHPQDLIVGLVASIFLHSILLIEVNKWLPKHKRELAKPIPIEFVEVPPQDTKPPQETKRRAANNSVAGGEAKPERPVSIARLTPPVKPKASASSPKNSLVPEPAKSTLPKTAPSAAILPDRSLQKQQTTPPKKIAADTTTSEPKPPKIVTAPPILKPQPKLQEPAVAPNISPPKPKPEAARAVPTTPKPKPLTRQQLESKTTTRSPSRAQRSQASGAARLGGPISLSSRDRGANSNRFNQGAARIDARRDTDIGPYLQQLQQRVRQQWIPGITRSSYRTVVYFAVIRSGQVRNLRIVGPSGSSEIDRAAVSAVQQAAPFVPLPTGFSYDYINITFTFNVNVSGELELQAR